MFKTFQVIWMQLNTYISSRTWPYHIPMCICFHKLLFLLEFSHPLSFLGFKITVDGDCSQEIKRHLLTEWKAMTNLGSILKTGDNTLLTKVCIIKFGFSSSHVQMWELDHKEGWAPKNWFFQIVVLEKTLKSHLHIKEIKPVNPKGNQPWVFIGNTDAEAEAPILWPPDAKSWLIGKDSDAGKNWRQKEKGTTEEEMVGWHH